MIYLNDKKDFGYMLIAAVRMYRRKYDPEIVDSLYVLSKNFMPALSNGNLEAILRELQPDSVESGLPIPEVQQEAVDRLYERLASICVCRILGNKNAEWSQHNVSNVRSFGWSSGCLQGRFKEMPIEVFINWCKKILADRTYTVEEFNLSKELAISDEQIDGMRYLMVLGLEYASGRKSMMPMIAAGFISANIDLVEKNTAVEMLQIIQNTYDSCFLELQEQLAAIVNV